MTSTPVPASRSRRDAVGASAVAAASVWSAVVTYVVLIPGAHVLGTDGSTVLVTFLSLLFAVYGVLSGVSLEVTRSVAAAVRDGSPEGPALWRVAAFVAACAAAVVALLAPVWHDRVLHGAADPLVPVLVAAVAAYGVHCVLVGAAAGHAWWRESAYVVFAEATVRLVASLVVVLVAASVVTMGVASALGALAWVLLLAASPRVRSALHLRADVAGPVLARRIGAAVLAQGASAVLVVGFPILLAATTSRADYRDAAPLLLAISLTRAPVLLPLNALQGVAVSHLVRAGAGLARLLLRMLAAVAAVGLVGAVAAWAVGPWLMELLLGADFRVDGPVLAALTAASAGIAALTLTGACAQALAAHAWYVAGWLVAVATGVLLLQLPGSLEWRACVALAGAPVPGLAVHVVGLLRVRGARLREVARG